MGTYTFHDMGTYTISNTFHDMGTYTFHDMGTYTISNTFHDMGTYTSPNIFHDTN
jgi:hypothetical protein